MLGDNSHVKHKSRGTRNVDLDPAVDKDWLRRLAIRVIARAVKDYQGIGVYSTAKASEIPLIRKSAREFLLGKGLIPWAITAGIEPSLIRSKVRKLSIA